MKREYAEGTYTLTQGPWDVFVDAKAKCTDGKIRKVKRIAICADTFFSVPASVEVRKDGKRYTVAGYITFQTSSGNSIDMPDDPVCVWFFPYRYRKNGHLLPERISE